MTFSGVGQIRDSPHRPSILRRSVCLFSFLFWLFLFFFGFLKKSRKLFLVALYSEEASSLSPIFHLRIACLVDLDRCLFSRPRVGISSLPILPDPCRSATAIMSSGSVSRSQQQHKVFMASVSQIFLHCPIPSPDTLGMAGNPCGCPSLPRLLPRIDAALVARVN